VGEMRLRCGGPQARIDPDEEQLEAGAYQVRNRGITKGLQLRLSKAHTGHRSGQRIAILVTAARGALCVVPQLHYPHGMPPVSLSP
jgi:hypothetical protein